MQRRTLDILFSVGGVLLAGLLLAIGVVLTTNANFANNYVRDQLGQQNITFKTADTLTAEEKKADCLVEYAGQKLTTGAQEQGVRGARAGRRPGGQEVTRQRVSPLPSVAIPGPR